MIFMIVIFLLSYSSSYAAVLQIKNINSATVTNYTISDFYLMAEGLTGTGQALEGTNVDVKMANNYEWAAVSYFSNSAYGTGGSGGNSGLNVSGKYSTNGNITGVMDWGRHRTYTAGIIDSYASKTLTDVGNSQIYSPGTNVILNKAGTNAIDKFPNQAYNEDIAAIGWSNGGEHFGNNENYPYSDRAGLFGFAGGHPTYVTPRRASGAAVYDTTFRPVFYAQ